MIKELFMGEEDVKALVKDMGLTSNRVNHMCAGAADRTWEMDNFSK